VRVAKHGAAGERNEPRGANLKSQER
jgi:hypothetical protein